MVTPSPEADYKKEVRFAVVMYGGVSLAIYINGVAQELFRLVRSTAPAGEEEVLTEQELAARAADTKAPKEEKERAALSGSTNAPPNFRLSGTERVYRKLSHLLSYDDLRKECQRLADQAKADPSRKQALKDALEAAVTDDTKVVRTGFIVDILSGTSAGGINSIYLAKALANEQRIDRLKQLWITEGDIEVLLNDSRSLEGVGLEEQDPPQSLLNSRRMYFKLLKALDDMDGDDPIQNRKSPYAKELDLYITATDIEGVPVPLKLADKIVYERRHRNVFHFAYQDKVNDFVPNSNPFLAFAARCTSSFPFAFEPMRLQDMDEVLDLIPAYRDNPEYKGDSSRWQRYFKDIIDPKTGVASVRFAKRSFGDGGYLDNKPFSYAIEALVRRQSDVPVDRRLIYIEPSPEHPEDEPERDLKPDALQNVKIALDLPSYETIREDLQKVLQRNLLIERVQRIITSIENDVNNVLPKQLAEKLAEFKQSEDQAKAKWEKGRPRNSRKRVPMWSQRNLTATMKEKGRSFLSYRKLRISAVTDEIARLIARLLNIDSDSDLLVALRCLIRAWREENYEDNPPDSPDAKPSLNQFLTDFDLSHRLRRLNFLREKIDALYDYGWATRRDLREFKQRYESDIEPLLTGLTEPQLIDFREENADIGWLLGLLNSSNSLAELQDDQRDELRDVLLFMKSEVNEEYKELQSKARRLRQRRAQLGSQVEVLNKIVKPIEDIGITVDLLKAIIDPKNLASVAEADQVAAWSGSPNEDDCLLVAKKFFREHASDGALSQKINTAVVTLRTEVEKAVKSSRERMGAILDPHRKIKPKSKRGKEYFEAHVKDEEVWRGSKRVHAVREHLAYYYYNFEEYDQISFPIFYEADVGEASTVEVIRVSPEDATTLIDEREEKRNSPTGKGRQKLAGVSLHHFGAFLDRTWRQNDIMWGRLDGFERLVTALLPTAQDANLRNALIEEGHTSILIDELPPEGRLQLGGVVSEALLRASAGEPMEQAVAKVTNLLTDSSPVRTRLEKIVRYTLTNEELLDFIKKGYEVNRKLDPKPLLTTISRSTQIIGKVFEDIANANQLDGKNLAWIARLGKLFWGLVEVAVPSSLKNMMLDQWLSLIYAFEVFVIVGGLLLTSQSALQFGWTALGITLVLNIIVLVLKDLMRGRRAVLRITGVLVAFVFLFLSALGLLEILGPVFKVTWGSHHLHPMYWLKENIRNNTPGGDWIGQNIFSVGLLIGVVVLVLLLNRVFGVIDFSWFELRWQFLRKWFRQSKWGASTSFKPIRLISESILETARPVPGQDGYYLLSFALSALPSNYWSNSFESDFKAANQEQSAPQVSINSREVIVVSSAASLPELTQKLAASASAANDSYTAALRKSAQDDFEDHKRRMATRRSQLAVVTLPDPVRDALANLRDAGSKTFSTGASVVGRLIGILTIVMGIGLLYGLIHVAAALNQHPAAKLPARLHNPTMAMELARSPSETVQVIQAEAVLADSSPADQEAGKAKLRQSIMMDWVLILYFTIVIGFMCWWLNRFHRETEVGLTPFAIVVVLGAAIFDIVENNSILHVLKEQTVSQASVNWIWISTTLKWLALFLLLGLIGRLFRMRVHKVVRWTGVLLLTTAIVGVLGLVVVRMLVEVAFWMMALDLLVVGVVFLIKPKVIANSR
jgi:patatin-related protein